ncbi:response regulator transcription factor [Flavobacterium silvisoli]|uniref:Response regulator transcription factor n=1 Tax=Flavobacterium silvisoli TaxID=2529433 RepID=A0A4Q9ZA76_9FLAO|nr:response regulator [Flavobacterium silvisoli]TBX71109.1 response regulator transcription factor [Flavobacterium silvisoli]
MKVEVFIVDDHPPIIEGYKSILAHNPYGYIVNTQEKYNCEDAYHFITNTDKRFDLVFLDMTLPPYPEKGIFSGQDLVKVIRQYMPGTKIAILTSHTEAIVLQDIIKEQYPNGLLVKSDITSNDFLEAFDKIIRGEIVYSQTAKFFKDNLKTTIKPLDSYNRRIILLLSKGTKTKTIQETLHLSKSAIDKRKVAIKEFLGIEKGNDEDILREARKQGLI